MAVEVDEPRRQPTVAVVDDFGAGGDLDLVGRPDRHDSSARNEHDRVVDRAVGRVFAGERLGRLQCDHVLTREGPGGDTREGEDEGREGGVEHRSGNYQRRGLFAVS